jgi:Tropinone reductase 1
MVEGHSLQPRKTYKRRPSNHSEFGYACFQGDRVHVVAADVTQVEGRAAVFQVIKKIGRLDILVNNVGTNIRKKLIEISTHELNLILSTNLMSALEMCRNAHPWLLKGSDASVIFITSMAGFGSTGVGLIYSATKAALNQATPVIGAGMGC